MTAHNDGTASRSPRYYTADQNRADPKFPRPADLPTCATVPMTGARALARSALALAVVHRRGRRPHGSSTRSIRASIPDAVRAELVDLGPDLVVEKWAPRPTHDRVGQKTRWL